MTVAKRTLVRKHRAQLGARNSPALPAILRSASREPAAAAGLLAWYDQNRRVLPWRALPGERPDPYRVWLAEIMLQQTTVAAVAPYFARFLARFPTVKELAAADTEEVLRLWAGLGYYARARNLHACAKAVAARGGFPDCEEELRELPGIGAYTAAAVAAIAFNQDTCPVDGNVERVVTRLFAVEAQVPAARPAIRALAGGMVQPHRAGDFAQAMMDLGATVCTPKAPACMACPFAGSCAARARGDAESFPRKAKKTAGRLRRGAAFVAIRPDGSLLVRRRSEKGLLGGMTEVPTSAWLADYDDAGALGDAPVFELGRGRKVAWRRVPGVVTHVFTHFPLELTVWLARLPASAAAPAGTYWLARDDIMGAALPTVMRKVLALALGSVEQRD